MIAKAPVFCRQNRDGNVEGQAVQIDGLLDRGAAHQNFTIIPIDDLHGHGALALPQAFRIRQVLRRDGKT